MGVGEGVTFPCKVHVAAEYRKEPHNVVCSACKCCRPYAYHIPLVPLNEGTVPCMTVQPQEGFLREQGDLPSSIPFETA